MSFVSWNKALWSFCISLELSFFLTWYFIKIKGEQIFPHFSFLRKFIRRTQRAIYLALGKWLGLKHLDPFLLVFSGSLQMNARVQERHKKNSHENRLFKNWAKINWQDRLNIKLDLSHGLSTGRKNFSRKNNRATHPTSENLSPQISYECTDQRLIFILDLLASLPVTKVHILFSLSLIQVIFKALKYPDEKKTSLSLLIHDQKLADETAQNFT